MLYSIPCIAHIRLVGGILAVGNVNVYLMQRIHCIRKHFKSYKHTEDHTYRPGGLIFPIKIKHSEIYRQSYDRKPDTLNNSLCFAVFRSSLKYLKMSIIFPLTPEQENHKPEENSAYFLCGYSVKIFKGSVRH